MTESPGGLSSADPARAPPRLRSIVRALRPRQWTKNGALLAPLLFARQAFHPPAVVKALEATLAFCLIASAVYVLNDWLDREKDRLHPEKRHRPIAAGLLTFPWVLGVGLGCGLAGAALSAGLGRSFSLVVGGYLALQVAYSLVLKHAVILDVMAIASGFVLRVIAGGVAIDVPVSNWLFLCTLLLAVFLGFAKRRHELSSLQDNAGSHRASLSNYSLPMLDQMMSVVAAACIVAYGLYSVSLETVQHVGSDRMKYTVPFVIYGIFRYLFLIHRRNAGGSPERVLLSDGPLLADLLLFVLLAGWALYV